jgi:hypothetical protein
VSFWKVFTRVRGGYLDTGINIGHWKRTSTEIVRRARQYGELAAEDAAMLEDALGKIKLEGTCVG